MYERVEREVAMDINMTDIGNRIRDRRKELGLTQTDIHEKCGIASGALSQMECGNRTPSALTLYKLSTALDCTTDWLITGFSMNPKNSELTEQEEDALLIMRQLPPDDRDELYEIMGIKLRKMQRIAMREMNQTSRVG